jgi:REP element-mobilizing transposase RayT
MDKFDDIYHIETARMKGYDYSSAGVYFITICTYNKQKILGEIIDGAMYLSSIGNVVREEWIKSFNIRKELSCDEYVIMPDHIHAILRIAGPKMTNKLGVIIEQMGPEGAETSGLPFETNIVLQYKYRHSSRLIPKSISSFVAGFKSAATKRLNQYNNSPGATIWQTRFYDHIIRSNDEYFAIKYYIRNNPVKWGINNESSY